MNDNNQNNIDELVNSSILRIKDLAQTNTIIGKPLESANGTIIIPISKVSVGFVVGSGQYNSVSKKLPYPTAGGSGGGVSLSPIGFIIDTKDEVKYVDVENKSAYQTILNLASTLMNKTNQQDNKNEKE